MPKIQNQHVDWRYRWIRILKEHSKTEVARVIPFEAGSRLEKQAHSVRLPTSGRSTLVHRVALRLESARHRVDAQTRAVPLIARRQLNAHAGVHWGCCSSSRTSEPSADFNPDGERCGALSGELQARAHRSIGWRRSSEFPGFQTNW